MVTVDVDDGLPLEKGIDAIASKKGISHRFTTQLDKSNPDNFRLMNLYLLAELSKTGTLC
jgi:hypothetical protein